MSTGDYRVICFYDWFVEIYEISAFDGHEEEESLDIGHVVSAPCKLDDDSEGLFSAVVLSKSFSGNFTVTHFITAIM